MNIAFIVDEFPSLSQTFVLNQITGLLDRGHQVDVFTRELKSGEQQHPDVARYQLLERTFHFSCPLNRRTRIVRGAGLFLRKLRANPRAVLGTLNVFRYGRGASSLTLLFQTAPFFRRYDILHCQFGHNGRFGAILKKLGLQKKLVVTFHGYDIRAGIEGGGRLFGDLWQEADCLIAISNYNREYLLRFGGDPEKIVYHPVGIDCRRFSYHRGGEREQKKVRIVSVARLVSEKGLDFGIRAVDQLRATCPQLDFSYTIIGEGPRRADLQGLIERLDLQLSVKLVGAKPQDKVIAELCESDILLAPSLAEALPVSLMEAHAVGLPVIATRVGSVDQIVRDSVTGFLVPPGDVDALARRLAELIGEPDKRAEMGRRGRRHIEQHYDIDRLNDRLVSLYQELLAA
jgi:colanic acid/amylovoran biosynthesis glycosyltransferase